MTAVGEAAPAAAERVKKVVGTVKDKVVSSARALSERNMQVQYVVGVVLTD